MKKVTDLEEFALIHIIRPYQTDIGFKWEEKIRKNQVSLDEIVVIIKTHPSWWKETKSRILRIGFIFPPYIQHPIINLIYAD